MRCTASEFAGIDLSIDHAWRAGEYYVMCQLLRRGHIAALAPAGVPNADIIVTDEIGDRLCAVQVKARMHKGADGGWHMKAKHESIRSDTLFYAFVDFGADLVSPPISYIVPSAVVADVIQQSHQLWLSTPGQKAQQRKTVSSADFFRTMIA